MWKQPAEVRAVGDGGGEKDGGAGAHKERPEVAGARPAGGRRTAQEGKPGVHDEELEVAGGTACEKRTAQEGKPGASGVHDEGYVAVAYEVNHVQQNQ